MKTTLNRATKWQILFLGLLFIIVSALGTLTIYNKKAKATSATEDIVVTLTDRGFYPNKVIVNTGDKVVFRNSLNREYWPASNAHPSHGMYPDFDPKKPVAPKDSWSFVFDRPGVWDFHDHLDDLNRGTVVVVGGGETALQDCLSRSSTEAVQAICWQPAIEQVYGEKGLDAVFAYVRNWQKSDALFQRNCHDVMHIVGEIAYREFRKDGQAEAREEEKYCGYGFYHGFIETMFAKSRTRDLQEVKQYCDIMDAGKGVLGNGGPCYHGIGHAVLDSLPATQWGDAGHMLRVGVDACRKLLTDPWQYKLCVTGVSNGLANAMGRLDYKLKQPDRDSGKLICSTISSDLWSSCYPEIVAAYLSNTKSDLNEALAVFDMIDNTDARYETVRGYLDSRVRVALGEKTPMSELLVFCKKFKGDSDRTACVDGVATGLFAEQVGETSSSTPLGTFCGIAKNLTASSSEVCGRYVK